MNKGGNEVSVDPQETKDENLWKKIGELEERIEKSEKSFWKRSKPKKNASPIGLTAAIASVSSSTPRPGCSAER